MIHLVAQPISDHHMSTQLTNDHHVVDQPINDYDLVAYLINDHHVVNQPINGQSLFFLSLSQSQWSRCFNHYSFWVIVTSFWGGCSDLGRAFTALRGPWLCCLSQPSPPPLPPSTSKCKMLPSHQRRKKREARGGWTHPHSLATTGQITLEPKTRYC